MQTGSVEDHLTRKVSELAKDNSGVLIVDKYGLPIESKGYLEPLQAPLVSSIMKSVGKLSVLLSSK